MSLRHGGGLHPPQTVTPIHIRHIQSVWAYWYAAHWHTLSVLHRFGGSVSLMWSQNDAIAPWLRLIVTSNYFSHPYYTLTKHLSTLILFPYRTVHEHTLAALHSKTPNQLGSDFGVLGHLCRAKMMSLLRHGWGWQPPQTAFYIHIRHIQNVWAH